MGNIFRSNHNIIKSDRETVIAPKKEPKDQNCPKKRHKVRKGRCVDLERVRREAVNMIKCIKLSKN